MLNIIKRFLPRSAFYRNVLTMATGQVLAQGIIVLVSPVISRLYSPEEIGLYAIFMSATMMLLPLTSWRYERAIVLPSVDDEASNVLVLTLIVTIVSSFLIFILIVFFHQSIDGLFETVQLIPWLWLLPVGVFVNRLNEALSLWNLRKKRFKNIVAARVGQAGSLAGTQVVTGMAGIGEGGLIGGYLLGWVVGAAILGLQILRENFRLFWDSLRFSRMIYVLQKYRKFPIYSTWGVLMNTSANQIIPILLAVLYGPAVAGFYALGSRAVSAPAFMVNTAVAQVFYQRASQDWNEKGDISGLVEKVAARQAVLAILPLMILGMLAPPIFKVVFGDRWVTSGRYVQILVPLVYMRFIVSPVSTVFAIREKQEVVTLIQALMLMTAVGSIWLGKLVADDPIVSLSLYSLSQFLVLVLYMYFILYYSKASLKRMSKEFSRAIKYEIW